MYSSSMPRRFVVLFIAWYTSTMRGSVCYSKWYKLKLLSDPGVNKSSPFDVNQVPEWPRDLFVGFCQVRHAKHKSAKWKRFPNSAPGGEGAICMSPRATPNPSACWGVREPSGIGHLFFLFSCINWQQLMLSHLFRQQLIDNWDLVIF